MSQSFPDLIDDLNAAIGTLRAGAPEPMRAFSGLAREALKPGALDVRTKELIAIGIAAMVFGICSFCHVFDISRMHALEILLYVLPANIMRL